MSLIQINCDTPNSEIYYSINNVDLNIKYIEPFNINESSTIYAIGKKEGWIESNIENLYVEELPKLPTPIIVKNTFNDDGGYLVQNGDEYPENTFFHFFQNGEIAQDDLFIYVMNNNNLLSKNIGEVNVIIPTINNAQFVAVCEGYENSDPSSPFVNN